MKFQPTSATIWYTHCARINNTINECPNHRSDYRRGAGSGSTSSARTTESRKKTGCTRDLATNKINACTNTVLVSTKGTPCTGSQSENLCAHTPRYFHVRTCTRNRIKNPVSACTVHFKYGGTSQQLMTVRSGVFPIISIKADGTLASTRIRLRQALPSARVRAIGPRIRSAQKLQRSNT